MASYKQKYEEQVQVAIDFEKLANRFQRERDDIKKDLAVKLSNSNAETNYWRGKFEGYIDSLRNQKEFANDLEPTTCGAPRPYFDGISH